MRAELFSSDFIISFFIFISVMIIITAYFQNLEADVYETNQRNDMYYRAINIGSLLATSSGYPDNWNSSDVQIIGLYDSGKFNLTKMEYLINDTDYQSAKNMLGTGVYNFLITMKNSSGYTIKKPGTNYEYYYGKQFDQDGDDDDPDQIALVKRFGMVDLGGTPTKVTMEVILWL
jgi:hypothetical protein